MVRLFSLIVIAGLGLTACETTAPSSTALGVDGQPLPQVYRIRAGSTSKIQFRLLDSVNSLRQASGLPAVALNSQLTAAASTHSRDMSVQNRPWHFGSDGSSPIDRVQLESVLAHELMRIRSGEAMANLTAAALPGRLAGVAAGPASRLATMITEGAVVIEADRAATEITRYPPGLEGALASIHADGRTVANNSRAHRHLWLDVPADAVVTSTFDLGDRIAVLQEL